jgi:hypothetical protein
MKLPDCAIFNFDRKNEPIDYQARYQGQGINFLHLKTWSVKAERFDDEIESAVLRRWFDWQRP